MRLALTILALLPFFVFAQNSDSLRIAAWNEKSAFFLEENNTDSSEYYKSLALERLQKKDDLAGWLGVWSKLAKVYQQNDPDKAIGILKEGLAKKFRQPATEKEWDKLAWMQVKIAWLLAYAKGDFYDAFRYYEEAKRIFETYVDPEDLEVAQYVYRELGNIYTRLGDYEAAKILLGKFKIVSAQHEQFSDAADACADLATIFTDLEEYEAAVAVCKEGLQFPGLAAYSKGLLHGNLAKAFFGKKDYTATLRHATEAKVIFEKVVNEDGHVRAKAWLSNAWSVMGEANTALKNFPNAEYQLKKALEIALDFYAPDVERREVAKLYASLGTFYLAWNKPTDALEYYQMSLRCAIPSFEEKVVFLNPPVAAFYPENSIKEALLGKAACFEKLHVQDKNTGHLRRMLECRSLSFEVDRQLRQSYQFESSKLQIIEESLRESEQAISGALDLLALTGDESLKASAFQFAEMNKSVLLSEALKQSGANSVANVPDSLLRKSGALQEKIAGLEKSLFTDRKQSGFSQKDKSRLEEEILRKKKEQKDLLQRIEQDYPAYFHIRYKENLATVAEIQRLLRPDEALLEYFVGDSALYIFLLKKDAFHVERIEKNFPLEQWVTQFREDIEAFQFHGSNREELCNSYTHLAQLLYQKLVQPVEKYALPESLIIVPGGILGFLPFDALLYEAPPAPCVFKKYPYLVRRHTISYNYSSTLFKELLKNKEDKVTGFAGFAPEFKEGNGSGFGPLLFNIAGTEEIASFMGGQSFLRSSATGRAFLDNAGKHSILYLATHAKANTGKGDFSFIILTKEDGSYDTIFVKDIYNLQLAADLVFLGACETGSGKLYNGEGIISLARSFLYAGARSIVTTLWSINDEMNKNLTVRFFRFLKGGLRKDEALRKAKMEQLESSEHDLYAHPVYWAAYTPIGNMEPVKSKFNWWYLLVGVGLAGLFSFGIKKVLER